MINYALIITLLGVKLQKSNDTGYMAWYHRSQVKLMYVDIEYLSLLYTSYSDFEIFHHMENTLYVRLLKTPGLSKNIYI